MDLGKTKQNIKIAQNQRKLTKNKPVKNWDGLGKKLIWNRRNTLGYKECVKWNELEYHSSEIDLLSFPLAKAEGKMFFHCRSYLTEYLTLSLKFNWFFQTFLRVIAYCTWFQITVEYCSDEGTESFMLSLPV